MDNNNKPRAPVEEERGADWCELNKEILEAIQHLEQQRELMHRRNMRTRKILTLTIFFQSIALACQICALILTMAALTR